MTSASASLYDGHTNYDDGMFFHECSELGVASKPIVRERMQRGTDFPIETRSGLLITEPGKSDDTGAVWVNIADFPHFWAGGGGTHQWLLIHTQASLRCGVAMCQSRLFVIKASWGCRNLRSPWSREGQFDSWPGEAGGTRISILSTTVTYISPNGPMGGRVTTLTTIRQSPQSPPQNL